MELLLKNKKLVLLPQKAVWWEETATLIISDLHIGKILHFRKAGIALPQQALYNNFDRLGSLMNAYPVQRIIFTGDLFHSDINQEWEQFCEWRNSYHQVEMHIVLGNHDRLPPQFCNDFNMYVHQKQLICPPFIFTHKPLKTFTPETYVICGHIHPVVKLSGLGNQYFKLPCFHVGQQQMVLPSFGYFTGGYAIEQGLTDTVVAIANGKLIVLPPIEHG